MLHMLVSVSFASSHFGRRFSNTISKFRCHNDRGSNLYSNIIANSVPQYDEIVKLPWR